MKIWLQEKKNPGGLLSTYFIMYISTFSKHINKLN